MWFDFWASGLLRSEHHSFPQNSAQLMSYLNYSIGSYSLLTIEFDLTRRLGFHMIQVWFYWWDFSFFPAIAVVFRPLRFSDNVWMTSKWDVHLWYRGICACNICRINLFSEQATKISTLNIGRTLHDLLSQEIWARSRCFEYLYGLKTQNVKK